MSDRVVKIILGVSILIGLATGIFLVTAYQNQGISMQIEESVRASE